MTHSENPAPTTTQSRLRFSASRKPPLLAPREHKRRSSTIVASTVPAKIAHSVQASTRIMPAASYHAGSMRARHYPLARGLMREECGVDGPQVGLLERLGLRCLGNSDFRIWFDRVTLGERLVLFGRALGIEHLLIETIMERSKI